MLVETAHKLHQPTYNHPLKVASNVACDTVSGMTSPPPGYESHNEYLALGGVPRHIYFERMNRGESPQFIVESYLTSWDAGWPLEYRGVQFRNYHLLCDHLENTKVIRRPIPRSESIPVLSVYDRYAERDVLAWLAGNGYLAKEDAESYIAMVVAPFRRDSPTQNPRAKRFDAFSDTSCVQCRIETSPKQRMIRPKEKNDLSFTKAAMRRDFNPDKYEVWCRSCVAKIPRT